MQNTAMSPSETARKLGISLDAVYKLIYAGKLQGQKTRGLWIIAANSVSQRLARKGRHE
jgi:excisionase family DNA binding protein